MDIQTLLKKDVLNGINNYPEKLPISKVVLYFERKGIVFTKTMIQNYVKVGVLPPLYNQRYYNRTHLIFLVLIDILKNTYSLDSLKAVFEPMFALDYLTLTDLLKAIISNYNETIINENNYLQSMISQLTKFDNIQKNSLSYLLTMSKSSAIKDLLNMSLN